jgi:[ribosomal protein S18]-alanine N-acetyltransferase
MRDGDVGAVLAIEEMSFSNPWSIDAFRGEIQNRGISFPLVIVRASDGRIAGYIIYWLIREDVQINNVAVHPDFRGKGLGKAALKFVLKDVQDKGAAFVTLEVRPSNTPARALYEKLGFKVLGTRKGYYTNPFEDALVMGLALDE